MKIKVGDTVVIIAGKHRKATTKDENGKEVKKNTGKVMRVLPKSNQVVVEGINMVKRHVKKNRQRGGQVVMFEAPIDASNVMLIDPKTKKRTRVGYTKDEKGKKVRTSKKSNTAL